MFQGLQFPTFLKLANICLFRLDLAIVRSLQRSCAFLWKAIPHLPSPGSVPPPCDGRRSPSRGFFTPYWNGLLIYNLATWQNCKFPRSRDSILLLLYPQSQHNAQKITGIQEIMNDAIDYNTKWFGILCVPSLSTLSTPLIKEYHNLPCYDLSVKRDYYFI